MEKLFVQIFERKKSIIEQVKRQIDLYDQHLASKCLIDGIAPPPWLWSSAFPSQSFDLSELNKEELITKILLPHPRPAFPYSSSRSLFQHPVVTADNVDLRDVLCMGVCASNKGFHEGYGLPVSSHNPFDNAGCASSGGCEHDPSVTSPEDCRDAIISESYPDQELSFSRIHRSKSRQRALELRNSAKASKNRSTCKNNVGACASQITRSEIASLQSGHISELELFKPVNINNEGCTAEEAKIRDLQSKERGENVYSCRITRSRSSGQEAGSVSEPSNVGKSSLVTMEYGGKSRESIGKSLQKSHYITESLGLVKPSESYGVKKAKVRDTKSKEKERNHYCGRIKRSRCSSQQPNYENECLNLDSSSGNGKEDGVIKSMQQPNYVDVSRESIKPFDIESCGVKAKLRDSWTEDDAIDQYAARNTGSETTYGVKGKAKIGDLQSKERGENVYSCRITRSRSSGHEAGSVSEPSNVGKSCLVSMEDGGNCRESVGKSSQKSHHITESLGLVKSSIISSESCGVKKAKVRDSRNKEKENNDYCGRIARSRSSSQQPTCVNECLNLGSSSNNGKEDGVIKSMLRPNHVDVSRELIKPFDIIDESCGVKAKLGDCWREENAMDQYAARSTGSETTCGVKGKTKIGDLQGKERAENVYSCRITRSRSSGQEASSVSEPSNAGKSCLVSMEDGGKCREFIGKSSQKSHHITESLGLVKPSIVSSESCGVKKAKVRDSRSTERENNNYCERITRSRSPSQQPTCVNGCLNLDSSSYNGKEDGVIKSMQRPNNIDVSRELIKPFDIIDESYGVNVKLGDCWSKENAMDQYAARSTGSETTCGVAKPVNSLNNPGCRIAQSRSTAFGVPPIAESSKMFEGVDPHEVSGTQVKVLPHTDGSEIIASEICHAMVAEADTDFGGQIKAPSVSSASNLDAANLRVETEVLASSLPHDLAMFVKPKQLDFDDMQEYSLNETSGFALKKKKQGGSSKRKPFMSLYSAKKMDESTSMDCEEKFKSPEEMPMLEELEVLNIEGKPCRSSSEAHAELTYGVSQTPESNVVSSVKETSGVHIDVVIHTLQESNKLSKPNSLIDQSTKFGENSIENLLNEALISNSSDVNATKEIDFPFEEDIGLVDVVKPKNLIPKESNCDNVASSGHKMSMGTDFTLDGPVPFRSPDIALRNTTMEHPSASSVDGTNDNFVRQKINSGLSRSQIENSCFMGSCISGDRNLDFLQSSENQIARKSIQSFSRFIPHMDGSWPQHKRRKIEGQLSNTLPTSPGLRDDVIKLNHQSVEQHMTSSPKLQLQEGELSLKVRDRGADCPSPLIHEELGVSLVSSLTKHDSRDPQGCLLEETEAVDPTSLVFEATQLSIEDNKVILHHEDELGNTEHMTCTEETMQENLSHLGGNGEVSYNLVGSPHGQSMGLIGLDQTSPVFEGFIIQTDDEQPFIDGEHISFFDKLELPKTTIERASILEQLCKSACMHTPLPHFQTTYKFHETLNLHQSVPNGLLEGMDRRSSLPINDDTGKKLEASSGCLNVGVNHAFHGRSHSDCLPFFSAQSSWDIKKPCTSPVGKLWDRNTSKSGSSEKRGSLNPELPCISEENENMDEAADTFQEGICLEVMTNSIKRIPLADIRENVNPPASVPEDADRHSLDSINMEFSFTGTSNKFKSKLRNQMSSRRIYTSKGRENQSISLGANGAKRATESLHTRFNKPKLSGKATLREGGPSLAEMRPKCNNIVSNITSFVPLVQQKQAAAVITGKRHIKVNSLDAAKHVKRLAEEKENERKRKKEALKCKRTRVEQENLRQLELQKIKKEEERKKKEADMAERKRKKDEEERNKKKRKRKCVEDAQRQRRDNEEKLRANKEEKELKRRATDGRALERKESKDELGKVEKIEQEREDDNLGKMSEMEFETTRVSTSHATKATVLEESEAFCDWGDNSKVTSNLGKAMRNDILVTNTNEEHSYDISPYKCSDDEDEEEDVRNTKFVPSWASQNCIALVVSSQQSVDPEKIFPPDSFCSITEVLIPRKLQ